MAFRQVRIIDMGPSCVTASKRLIKSVTLPSWLNLKCMSIILHWSQSCNIRHFKFSRRSDQLPLLIKTELNSRPSTTKLSQPRKICPRWRLRQPGQVLTHLILNRRPKWWRPTSLKQASRSVSRKSWTNTRPIIRSYSRDTSSAPPCSNKKNNSKRIAKPMMVNVIGVWSRSLWWVNAKVIWPSKSKISSSKLMNSSYLEQVKMR